MIYNPYTRELRTDRGLLLKTLNCPLHKNWSQLTEVESVTPQRHCESCDKYVLDLTGWSDEEAQLFLGQDPEHCVYAPKYAPNIRFHTPNYIREQDPCPFRRVATAYGTVAIEQAVAAGFRPVIKRVKQQSYPSMMSVWQNEETGEIAIRIYDQSKRPHPWKCIIKPFRFHGKHAPHPIAAYLLPAETRVGERLFLTDLIQEPVPVSLLGRWTHKKESYPGQFDAAYAVWDGKDLKIERFVRKYTDYGENGIG